jgi:hypothetical protein
MITLLLALVAMPAQADDFPNHQRPVPTLAEWREGRALVDVSLVPGFSHAERVKMANGFTAALKAQYGALEALKKPATCLESSAADFALAQRALGRHEDCLSFTQLCAENPAVALIGAQCASDHFDVAKSEEFYERATAVSSGVRPLAAFEYAYYENFGPHPDRVDSILARETSWSESDRALWKGVIRRAGAADLENLTKPAVDRFLAARIADQSGDFHDRLLSARIAIEIGDDALTGALNDLVANGPKFRSPLLWYYHAYQASYYGFADDFRLARGVYDTYDRYSDRWTSLPTENNTYTYTEMYASACRANLLSGPDLTAFNALKASLRKGSMPFDTALARVTALAKKFPAKAEVLSAYGGLLSMAGQHAGAMDAYWNAHRACRYYNRANWGILLEKRYLKYNSLPDYAANEAKVAALVKEIEVPAVTSKYFVNWASLNASERERVLYGSRIWVPYYSTLSAAGSSVYIKAPFDLLSDSPSMSEVKDERIEGDGHDTDHRLWDDVRGLGGQVVIADANEVFQTAQGDYNLLGHEMTHQFHAFLSTQKSPLADCIEGQFALATSRKNFPDAYSGTNSKEFFAQGVTYYLVPEGSAERFGLNQSWLPAHNPLQFSFIRSIDSSGGDLSRITCSAN